MPQKVYYGIDTDKHGARLDVYLEEAPLENTEDGDTVYDMEPDKNDDNNAVRALPRRVLFYHAMIDGNSLNSGENYKQLKDVFVILITPYDPLNSRRMVYTIRNMCQEMPSLPYDDGAQTIFLYTKGTEGDPPKELRELLHYMENSTEENAINDNLKRIHQMVMLVKHDKEVILSFMKIFEREEMLRQQGRREEQDNTERERLRAESAEERAKFAEKRADFAEERANHAEQEIQFLKELLASERKNAL